VVEKKEIRTVRENDIDQISVLEQASFKDPYPVYFLAQLAHNNPDTFLVITIDKEMVGYAVAEDWTDHNHLISIAVRPDKRKRGLGIQLMLELEKRLSKNKPLRLEVRQSNKAAIQLYSKLGFARTDLAISYYTDGEDATVMEKPIAKQVLVDSQAS
jgi:[ribosomal protein S18]-alanine N-acetyltransferase